MPWLNKTDCWQVCSEQHPHLMLKDVEAERVRQVLTGTENLGCCRYGVERQRQRLTVGT